ncbi:MAG: hypothetical protein QOI34_1192 [Verrucomicrobiota bacterium]
MNDVALARPNNGSNRTKLCWRFARTISWVAHPLAFVSTSLAIVVLLKLANRVGLSILLALFVSVVLPTALLLFRGVRSGRWSDGDVSIRSERMHFYPGAIVFSAAGVAALLFLHAPDFMMRGALITLALLVLAALANFRTKLSLHALFAFYCALILLRVYWLAGVIGLLVALLVFWSRLYLRRHDLPEMLTGTLFGVSGGIVAAWWP